MELRTRSWNMLLLLLLVCSIYAGGVAVSRPSHAAEGWYRFPSQLQGCWKIEQATTGDHPVKAYIGQVAEIDGDSLLLRTDSASNTYRITYVKPSEAQIELDLTATAGNQTRTFRCVLVVLPDQLRLIRPQNGERSRPRDINAPDASETVFTLVREAAKSKPAQ